MGGRLISATAHRADRHSENIRRCACGVLAQMPTIPSTTWWVMTGAAGEEPGKRRKHPRSLSRAVPALHIHALHEHRLHDGFLVDVAPTRLTLETHVIAERRQRNESDGEHGGR